MNEQVDKIQYDMFSLLDPTISRVFRAEDIKNAKTGQVVGVAIKPMKRSEMAAANGLKTGKNDKDKLDAIELRSGDGLLALIKGEVAKLNGEWTAKAGRAWTDKNGERNLSFRLKEVKRSMTEEKLANGIFPSSKYPTMTMDEKYAALAAMRESQEAQLAGNTVETNGATGEAKPAVDAAPAPEPPTTATPEPAKPIVDEAEEAELARMIADEAAANAAKS